MKVFVHRTLNEVLLCPGWWHNPIPLRTSLVRVSLNFFKQPQFLVCVNGSLSTIDAKISRSQKIQFVLQWLCRQGVRPKNNKTGRKRKHPCVLRTAAPHYSCWCVCDLKPYLVDVRLFCFVVATQGDRIIFQEGGLATQLQCGPVHECGDYTCMSSHHAISWAVGLPVGIQKVCPYCYRLYRVVGCSD